MCLGGGGGKFKVYNLFSSLQNNASKLLLAIMESRHDSENAERILYNMSPKQLVCSICTLNVYRVMLFQF